MPNLLTVFLRTFTHVGLYKEFTQGALVLDSNDQIYFVHSCGWYKVNYNFIAFHDAEHAAIVEELRK